MVCLSAGGKLPMLSEHRKKKKKKRKREERFIGDSASRWESFTENSNGWTRQGF